MKEKTFIEDNIRVFVVPVDILTSDLSAQEKLVYITLRSFVNPHKNEAFPGIDTIASLASISRSTVIRVLKSLEDKGFLTKETRFQYDQKRKTARQTSNLYKLALPKPISQGGVTQTPGGGCHTDTGGVSHRHGGGVTQTPEHNHLKESFKKEEEEEDIYDQLSIQIFGRKEMSPTEGWFIQFVIDKNIPIEAAQRIANKVNLSQVDKNVFFKVIDTGLIRLKQGRIKHFANWIIGALENEQLMIDVNQ